MSSISRCSYHMEWSSNFCFHFSSYISWNMSLNLPSYFFRIVFLVLKYIGHFFEKANANDASAKALMDSSTLYMVSAMPGPLKSNTSSSTGVSPRSGTKIILSFPGPSMTVSVARY
uniref:Uncharacterized protein MANES_17G114300 n=1 Tax=Rhizophora mucronata TaxID=61149 RepID=A0A2P2INJ5_RHIMU